MKSLLLLLFFVVVIHTCHTAPTTPTIGYQLHSVNDLREWKQFFRKGMEWIKIDMYYLPHEDCKQLDNLSQEEYEDKRGCFIMSHDKPTSRNQHYSTALSMLKYVSETEYFKRNRVYIALCFKPEVKDFPCSNTTESENWRSLVTSFVERANQVVEENKLKIEFFLDGNGKPDRPCLTHLWRPWKSVWIVTPSDALFSDDYEKGYDRFQVLNQPEGAPPGETLKRLQVVKYGKFLKSKYPWLLYEPSDQKVILQIADVYMSHYPNLIHEPGFLFSINIDPVQFEVFSGSRSGKAWNIPFAKSGKFPQVAVFETNIESFIVSIYEISSKKLFSVFSTDRVLGNLTTKVEVAPFPPTKVGTITSAKTAMKGNDNYLLISDEKLNFGLYVFKENDFIHVLSGSLNNSEPVKSGSATMTLYEDNLLVATTSTRQDCSLLLEFWILDKTPRKLDSEKCLVPNKQEITATSVDMLYHEQIIQGMVFYSDSDKHIRACSFRLNKQGTILSKCSDPKRYLDVGTAPRVSLKYFEKTIRVLQVHTEGFCYNTHWYNIRAHPSICDITPKPCPATLVYNYGTLAAFESKIRTPEFITSCDNEIVHGAYDRGVQPSVALFTAKDNLGVAEIHRGERSVDIQFCGSSIHDNVLVLDSWRLSNLNL